MPKDAQPTLSSDEIELLAQFNDHAHQLFKSKMYLPAASIFKRCMEMQPDQPEFRVNYGSALWHLGRYDEAEQVLSVAVKRWFKYDDALENYGKVLVTLERYAEAEAMFNTLIQRKPDHHRAYLQRAFGRLTQGNWEQGLEDYDHRIAVGSYPPMPMAKWEGQDLSGKTLYVQAEQGAGDTILFSRYLWQIKQRWPDCRISFCCAPALIKLLWLYQDRGVVTFLPEGVPWTSNRADYGIYLMSLPRLFNSVPDSIPLDPGLIEQRCSAQNFSLPPPTIGVPLKVGVCWTGNPDMMENRRRSIPLEKLVDLGADYRWLFYSLQYGHGVDEFYGIGANEVICDLSKEIGPPMQFVAAAAAMAKLDLVITMCTATAHLAGAMGIRTWLLLGKEPYWIWGREGTTTGWYPSMRIFRQTDFNSWDDVFEDVRSELAKLYETI